MRKYHQLSQEERYTITGLLRSHKSRAYIARELKRSPSTITRELVRNRKPSDHIYRAEVAHSYATARRRRAHRGSRSTKKQLRLVIRLLKQNWSPEQISNVLWKKKKLQISHETIYKFILQDKKKGGILYNHLRIMPKLRRKRYNSHDFRGILRGKRHISKRPKNVERRKVFAHWEGFPSLLADAGRKEIGICGHSKVKNQDGGGCNQGGGQGSSKGKGKDQNNYPG
jgi:transposase, IS30 family